MHQAQRCKASIALSSGTICVSYWPCVALAIRRIAHHMTRRRGRRHAIQIAIFSFMLISNGYPATVSDGLWDGGDGYGRTIIGPEG